MSDRDVVATALRETREELGITVSPESVWGTLKPLRDAVRLPSSLSRFLLLGGGEEQAGEYPFLFSLRSLR